MPAGNWILHVDLDQFICSVEVARRPELRGRPVVVGGSGDPTQRRQVVAGASYEARAFGVHAGMPLRTAARRCPEATFLPSDPSAYEEASRRVMEALRRLPVLVEEYGWDEAFLGASADEPETVARKVRRGVLDATGLSCSVGIGDNKLRAKVATRFAKPAGIYRLTRENWMEVMAHRSTDALWGIGPRTARKLEELGLRSVGDLARADVDMLAARFGPAIGPWLRQLARGIGETTVVTAPRVPVSRSRETTFPEDLTARTEIVDHVRRMTASLAAEAASQGRSVVRVWVKVRFAPFFTQIRSRTLPAPTSDTGEIANAALAVLDRFEDSRPVRLLGVRIEFDRGASAG
jgi:DNA polymerase IV